MPPQLGAGTNSPSFMIWSDGGFSAFTFNNLQDAVDTGQGDFLVETAGPEDFELVDFRGGAQTEVDAGVGSGRVTPTAENVAALADTAGGEDDFGADGVARGVMR